MDKKGRKNGGKDRVGGGRRESDEDGWGDSKEKIGSRWEDGHGKEGTVKNGAGQIKRPRGRGRLTCSG